MKKFKTFLPVFLFSLSALCLIAGIAIYILFNPEPVSVISVEPVESVIESGKVQEEAGAAGEEPVADDVSADNIADDTDVTAVSENEAFADDAIEEPEVIAVENPYKDYFLENSDMIAWLKIPDTEIDYPVMWTPGDETYYLYRNFEKVKGSNGIPFLDTDSTMYPSSTNLIIHGHNIKNTQFYFLLQYKDEDYCKAHPYIYLYGRDCEHIYEVMAVFRSQVYYTTDTCFKYYKFFNAYTDEEFSDFYDNVKELALYDTGVTASFGDRFLTLSTCSSHTKNGRFVVVAKEIESGESYLPISQETEEIADNQ